MLVQKTKSCIHYSRIVDNPNDGGERRPGNTSFYTDVVSLYRKRQTQMVSSPNLLNVPVIHVMTPESI